MLVTSGEDLRFLLSFKWFRVNDDTSRNYKLITAIFNDPVHHAVPSSESDLTCVCKNVSLLVLCSDVSVFTKSCSI
jgi:hypothetical protein